MEHFIIKKKLYSSVTRDRDVLLVEKDNEVRHYYWEQKKKVSFTNIEFIIIKKPIFKEISYGILYLDVCNEEIRLRRRH